ncbi:hypothetical protein [Martelella alba]|uniref:Uncharacterized protein n=1 Tax=Martelella alba TaxID=2590451 RepID=A0ABY2SJK1_9HYPH|nr:hypothetical protein [Martelella alba]TKI05504.1 hypothetical protein FCN80_14115 [Martelella alba]
MSPIKDVAGQDALPFTRDLIQAGCSGQAKSIDFPQVWGGSSRLWRVVLPCRPPAISFCRAVAP